MGVPNAARECGGFEPFVLPEAKHHAAITWVIFKGFYEVANEIIAVYDPAVSGADGVGEICFCFGRVLFGENFINITALIAAVFGNFPFVPNLYIAVLEPAHIVGSNLVNPENFKHGGFEANLLGNKDRELFFEVELENLVWKANSFGGASSLGAMIWNGRSDFLAAFVCLFVVCDFFAVRQNTLTKINVLIVKLTHSTSTFSIYYY